MRERDMVSDVLTMTKNSMNDYERAIGESSNTELRNALKQLRDDAEKFHEQLSQIATQKGYYPSSQTVSQQERQQVKSQLSQMQTTR